MMVTAVDSVPFHRADDDRHDDDDYDDCFDSCDDDVSRMMSWLIFCS